MVEFVFRKIQKKNNLCTPKQLRHLCEQFSNHFVQQGCWKLISAIRRTFSYFITSTSHANDNNSDGDDDDDGGGGGDKNLMSHQNVWQILCFHFEKEKKMYIRWTSRRLRNEIKSFYRFTFNKILITIITNEVHHKHICNSKNFSTLLMFSFTLCTPTDYGFYVRFLFHRIVWVCCFEFNMHHDFYSASYFDSLWNLFNIKSCNNKRVSRVT